ncbi:MAG TPA: hypothetical protein PLS10_01880 [Chitinophagales bacterium]|nr:hypothetical protein [Chitinophagales bacterium]
MKTGISREKNFTNSLIINDIIIEMKFLLLKITFLLFFNKYLLIFAL